MIKRHAVVISIGALVLMCLISLWCWIVLPVDAQIPVHWNFQGEVDRTMPKDLAVIMTPILASVLLILFFIIPKIEPRRENLTKSAKVWNITWPSLMVFMLFLHMGLMLHAMGVEISFPHYSMFLTGFLFVIMGNYLGKVRSNFMFGIRTPWTLSSELSWNKTHRLMGKLFVFYGFTLLISVWLFNFFQAIILFMGIGVIVLVIVAFWYSWHIWKQDPSIHH